MKRLLWFVLVAFAVAPRLRAESLGDAAKREEERRKKVEDSGEGSSQVIHETELWQNKGKIANEGGSSSSSAGTKSNPPDSRAPSSTPPARSTGTKGTNDESTWRARAAAARRELEYAQLNYDKVMKEQPVVKYIGRIDADGNEGVSLDLSAGQELLARQAAAKKRLDDARAAIDSLEEEARRAGALPGWLR